MQEDTSPRTPAAPQTLDYNPGQYIFREEEQTYELFVLEAGTVEVIVSEAKVTEISTPGAYLGEIGALLKRPRAATVRAVTPCRCSIYPDVQALAAADPEVILKIAETLAQRLVDMNERVDRIWGVLYRSRVGEDVINAVQAAVRGQKAPLVSAPVKKKWF